MTGVQTCALPISFVKAAWFIAPWYIKTDLIAYNCTNLTDIILALLSMNHPHATIANIFTFMWCIWKSRNNMLFQRKRGQPYQIFINAQALTNNLQFYDLNSSSKQENKQVQRQQINNKMSRPIQGSTISDNYPQGTIIYTDAAWKNNSGKGVPRSQQTGIGIYIADNSTQAGWKIKIQAATLQQDNAFQAEAKALSMAAKIANILQVDRPIYLTDNQVLAKIAAARTISHPLLHWNARHHLADFFRETTSTSTNVFHISRQLNGEAHNCAKQVLRHSLNQPIYQCTNSAHPIGACPVLLALLNVTSQDFVLTAAICS